MFYFDKLFSFFFGKKTKKQSTPIISEPRWREENGVIYFSVTSDGKSGYEWSNLLESSGIRVSPSAEFVIRSDRFVPTSGVTTEVAILKDLKSFEFNNYVNIYDVSTEAKRNKKLAETSLETLLLISTNFSKNEFRKMGINMIELMNELTTSKGVPFNIVIACKYDYKEINICTHFLTGPGGGGFFRKGNGTGFAYEIKK